MRVKEQVSEVFLITLRAEKSNSLIYLQSILLLRHLKVLLTLICESVFAKILNGDIKSVRGWQVKSLTLKK